MITHSAVIVCIAKLTVLFHAIEKSCALYCMRFSLGSCFAFISMESFFFNAGKYLQSCPYIISQQDKSMQKLSTRNELQARTLWEEEKTLTIDCVLLHKFIQNNF